MMKEEKLSFSLFFSSSYFLIISSTKLTFVVELSLIIGVLLLTLLGPVLPIVVVVKGKFEVVVVVDVDGDLNDW